MEGLLDALPVALLVVLAGFSAAATVNAIRPFKHTVLLLPSMLWSWAVLGLLPHFLGIQVVATAVLVALGALDSPIGWAALVVLVLSWIGALFIIIKTSRAGDVVSRALREAGVDPTEHAVETWRSVVAFPFRGRRISKVAGVPFRRVAGRTVKLDVYRDRTGRTDRPIFIYVHGGGWVMGDKREQGLPIIHHLARNGWLCFSVNYRLSPGATFPDHLTDVKAGIAWVKAHAAEYGGDPTFVALAGGSAGGHLTALAGLTENDPAYQPGFEEADTSLQVTVPIYGIYDATNRLGVQSPQYVPLLMEPIVIKAYLEDEPERFAEASPIDRIGRRTPPFVIAQGDTDTMAPVEEARAFVQSLRANSQAPVVYMEFPGAQHIFDLGYSYQSSRMIEGILAVLEDEYRKAKALR